jgi:hypothetical protein
MRLFEFLENAGKFYLQYTIVDNSQPPGRPLPLKDKSGETIYFDTIEQAQEVANARSNLLNRHGAKQYFRYEVMPVGDTLQETAAWKKKEGKNKNGGLNDKGIASYRKENPGSKLKKAVTTPPSKLDPDSKDAKRRKSFCARMGGMEGPMKKDNGEPTRKKLALDKWNCE